MRKNIFVIVLLLCGTFLGRTELNAATEPTVLTATHLSQPVYFNGEYRFNVQLVRDGVDNTLIGAWLWIGKLGRDGEVAQEWTRTLSARHRSYLSASPRRWLLHRLYVQSSEQTPEKINFLLFDRGDRYMALRDATLNAQGHLIGELREGNNPKNPNDTGVYRSTPITFTPVTTTY